MFKHVIVATPLMLICGLSFAITCPTITDIKKNALDGWIAYDSDEHKPLSKTREAAFIRHAYEFALAEWVSEDKNRNAIHCYYRDTDGSTMEAYFSKDNFTPKNANRYWYQVSGFMQCAAGANHCEFEHLPMQPTRLATKQLG